MADDNVTHLANLATDHGSYRTHYEGCHLYHLECAALIVCDEIERLRAQEQDLRMYAEQDACEIERLRSALAIAAGMISTMPQYEHQHPESVLDMLLEEARRG